MPYAAELHTIAKTTPGNFHNFICIHRHASDWKSNVAIVNPNSAGDTDGTISATGATSRAVLTKDHRVFAKIQFTQLTGNAHRNDGIVEAKVDDLGDGWLRITPNQPLDPGQYAIMPVFKVQNVFATSVFDFSVDPKAPNDADAISPAS